MAESSESGNAGDSLLQQSCTRETENAESKDTPLDLSVSEDQKYGDGRRIASFVMFDTETTGLPGPGEKPKITEFCLLAAQRTEFQHGGSPRVINKLQMCLNPQKPISPGSSMITGLFNDALETQTPFNCDIAQMISTFLQRLPQPVCLIAHNGNKFDFALLCSELNSVSKTLPETLLCVDSLEAFKQIEKENLTESWDKTVSTPLKRTKNWTKDCVEMKKPRKDPSLQECVYSDVQRELVTRKLDFQNVDDTKNVTEDRACQPLKHSFSVNVKSTRTGATLRQPIEQDAKRENIVKKLNFSEDEERNILPSCSGAHISEKPEDYSAKPVDMTKSGSLTKQSGNNIANQEPANQQLANQQPATVDLLLFQTETPPQTPPPQTPPPVVPEQGQQAEPMDIGNVVQNIENAAFAKGDTLPCPLQSHDTVVYWECSEMDKDKKKRSSDMEIDSQGSLLHNDFIIAVQNVEDTVNDSNKCAIPQEKALNLTRYSAPRTSQSRGDNSISAPQTNGEESGKDIIVGLQQCKGDNCESVMDVDESGPISCPVQDSGNFEVNKINFDTDICEIKNENNQYVAKSGSDPVEPSDVLKMKFDVKTSEGKTGTEKDFEESSVSPAASNSTSAPRISYRLGEVYRRAFGHLPVVAHTSEDDCITLLKLVQKFSPEFLKWADNSAVPFTSVKPMY